MPVTTPFPARAAREVPPITVQEPPLPARPHPVATARSKPRVPMVATAALAEDPVNAPGHPIATTSMATADAASPAAAGLGRLAERGDIMTLPGGDFRTSPKCCPNRYAKHRITLGANGGRGCAPCCHPSEQAHLPVTVCRGTLLWACPD